LSLDVVFTRLSFYGMQLLEQLSVRPWCCIFAVLLTATVILRANKRRWWRWWTTKRQCNHVHSL